MRAPQAQTRGSTSNKQLIEPGALGMSWPIDSRRFLKDPAAGILGRNKAGLGGIGPGDDRLVAEGHGGQ